MEQAIVLIVNAFLEQGARVLAYDPLAGETASHALGGGALILGSPEACLREADLAVIATPDPAFKAPTPAEFHTEGRRVIVVDCWRILTRASPRIRISNILPTAAVRAWSRTAAS
jgi:UDPglucose 6-dehydrogenase